MTFKELQEKVSKFDASEFRRRRIERFARGKAAIFAIIGSLLVCYGIYISWGCSPEEVEIINIPVITFLWNYIVTFFAEFGVPNYMTLFIIGIVSSFIAFLCTATYWVCTRKLKYTPQYKKESLENAINLQKRFENSTKDCKTNFWNNFLYFIGSFIIFFMMGFQISGNIVPGMIAGAFITLISYPVLFIIRGIFILISRNLWKLDEPLQKEIKNEFTKLIPRLDEEEYKREEEIRIEKEKREKEKQEEEIKRQQEKLVKDQLDGQKMYEEAIASDPVNEELMKDAARLGSVSACYYLGKKLLSDWASDMYTAEEKEEIAEDAAKYFDVARQIATLGKLDIKTECQFLWLFSRTQYESNTKAQWQQILNDLRAVQNAGDLPEEYSDTLELTIKSVIKNIDRLSEQSVTEPAYDTEPAKRLCCKFRNGAICTKESDSFTIRHCNHVNDPGVCLTAHDNHALEWR